MSAALETASSLQDPSTSVLLQLFMLFFVLSASSVYYWTHWFLYTKTYCTVREVYTALFFIWKKKCFDGFCRAFAVNALSRRIE